MAAESRGRAWPLASDTAYQPSADELLEYNRRADELGPEPHAQQLRRIAIDIATEAWAADTKERLDADDAPLLARQAEARESRRKEGGR